ncbi:MAG: cell division protein ZapA [Desulfotomaculum sp.]|nr:cell division protein ZapA [Desulfotomaculum sp.]
MDEQQNRVEVEINKQSYVLKGNESPAYMQIIAQYVDGKIKQVLSRNSMLSPDKAAVLAAINIADELNKLQEEYDDLVKMIDEDKQ